MQFAHDVYEYPLPLGAAYLFVVGYLARVAFAALRLPGAVGVFLVGYSFSFFMQEDILASRDRLQEMAFYLVLVNAGFEISIHDLRIRVILLTCIPFFCELISIAAYAAVVFNFRPLEAFLLANVCTPLGEGLVIPRMIEFRGKFEDHRLPPLVLAWAPLESTISVVLYGVLTGLSSGTVTGGALFAISALRLAVTVIAGIGLGGGTAWFLSNLSRFPKVFGRAVFTGSSVEAFLILVGMALAAFGAGNLAEDQKGWCQMLQPELLVIVTGSSFAHFVNDKVLHGVEEYIATIWVFGSIVLFGMLGSRSELRSFRLFPKVVPFMLVGLVFRFLGICAVCWLKPGPKKERRSFKVASFLFLCTLPRATMQGALGSWPVLQTFFGNHSDEVLEFIATSSKLYIFNNAILGSLLLESFGTWLLKLTRRTEEEDHHCGEELEDYGEEYDSDETEESESDEEVDVWQRGVSARSFVYRGDTL